MTYLVKKSYHALLLALAFTVLCVNVAGAASSTSDYAGAPAKYVFFFIGDGMGFPQKTAAEAFDGNRLVIDEFPAQGVTTTTAANRFITGSAASATALGSGQKTDINVIGMTPDFKPIKSIAELAREKGMKVGVVSSVSIDHATPAAFYAHVKTRKMYHEIDKHLAESGFDFFAGGGLKDPAGKKVKKKIAKKGKEAGKTEAQIKQEQDKVVDALELAKKNGYKIVSNKDDFMKLKPADGKVIAWNAWLQDSQALPYAMDMTDKDITLPEFTAKAVEMLDNPNGFFLMVEGGKIDWACHANDAVAAIQNTLAFDDAVKVAVEFAKKHPKETLIVTTGDHECGGLTLGFAGTKYGSYYDILGVQQVSYKKFTDEILANYKEECAKDGKQCDFASIQPMLTEYFGLKFKADANAQEGKKDQLLLKDYQIALLENAYKRTMAGEKEKSKDPQTAIMYGGYDPLTVQVTHLLNNNAGLGWTSYKHTAVPVGTSAMGVGADLFNGYYDNTDVAMKIMSIMGIKPEVHTAATKLKVAQK